MAPVSEEVGHSSQYHHTKGPRQEGEDASCRPVTLLVYFHHCEEDNETEVDS